MNLIRVAIILLCIFSVSASSGQSYQDDRIRMIDETIGLALAESNYHIKHDTAKGLYIIDEDEFPFFKLRDRKIRTFCFACDFGASVLQEGDEVWKLITSLDGIKYTVTILFYKATSIADRKKGVYLGVFSQLRVEFQYSCKKKKWVLLNTKSTSI